MFKTKADQFAGRINFFRVYQGVMRPDTQVLNTRAHAKERIGTLIVPEGREQGHADAFGPGDIGAVAKLKETRAGDWLAARDEPIVDARPGAAPAGHGLLDRAQGQGRRGQGLHLAAPPAGGGPDDRPAPRRADRRPDRRRAVADPRRDRRRPAEVALRRRGHAQAAARPLPGDDPQAGQGARAPQEADRRARAVRRLPHRDRAAARRHRLRVRQRDQGRRHPAGLHPGGREGLRGGDVAGRRGRLPGQGRQGAPLRRLLPLGGLERDGVQDGRLDRHEGGARAGRARSCWSRSCS